MKTAISTLRKAALGLGAGALAFGLAPAGLAPLISPAEAQSASDLDAVVAALRGISTMKADFTPVVKP